MWLGNSISQFVKVEMGECFNVTFYCRCKFFDRARLRVRVGALLLAEGWDDIDESSVVLHSSLSSSSLGLLLLLGVDLWGLSLDLTSSGKRTVDFTTKHSWDLLDLEAFGQTVLLEGETGLDDAAIDNGVGLLVEERKNLVGVLSVEAFALEGEMHFFGAE